MPDPCSRYGWCCGSVRNALAKKIELMQLDSVLKTPFARPATKSWQVALLIFRWLYGRSDVEVWRRPIPRAALVASKRGVTRNSLELFPQAKL